MIDMLVKLCAPGPRTMLNTWKRPLSEREEVLLLAALESPYIEVKQTEASDYPLIKVGTQFIPLDGSHWKALLSLCSRGVVELGESNPTEASLRLTAYGIEKAKRLDEEADSK